MEEGKEREQREKKFEHGLTTIIAVRTRNLSKPAQELHTEMMMCQRKSQSEKVIATEL